MLLTGATGFVGSHVADALVAAGWSVRALVRSPDKAERLMLAGIEVVRGELGSRDDLERAVAGVDVVLHLAGLTRGRSAAEYDAVNAAGTRTLLEAARRADPRPRRFVYMSSLAAAGPARDEPITANDEARPLTAYGLSKLRGERASLEAAGDFEVVVLRAPAVYGPRDRDMLAFFRLAARGVMPVPAGPERPVQLVHVADLADAVVRAATQPGATGIYHAAESRAYGWREVADLMGAAVGKRVRVLPVPGWVFMAAATGAEVLDAALGRAGIFNRDKARELLAPGWLCETERAWQDLGFKTRIPLNEGLAATAAWYRSEGWL